MITLRVMRLGALVLWAGAAVADVGGTPAQSALPELLDSSVAGRDSASAVQADWVRRAYQRSQQLEAIASYEQAVEALSTVQKAFPKGYAVNLRVGWLNYLAGKDQASETAYRQAVRIAPDAVEAKLGLLLPLLAQGRWGDAEALARQVLEVDPLNYYGNLRLLIALRAQKRFDQALLVSRVLVRRYPADTLFLTEYALALRGLGKAQESDAVFYDIQTLSPSI